jgi:two-component system nitrate/nitrite sensor histidine kinase NarX
VTRTSLRGLKWLTILVAIIFLLCVQGIAMGYVMPHFGRPLGHAVSIAGYSIGVILFTVVVYDIIERMQQRIVTQNEELAATNQVGRAVAGSLDIERLMDRALEGAVAVTRASAGDIVINDAAGREPLRRTSGTAQHVDEMDRLLAVPSTGPSAISVRDRVIVLPLNAGDGEIGAIHLLRGEGGPHPPPSVALLHGIASQIAMAVTAGRLYQDVAERQRTAQTLYSIAVDMASLDNTQDILWPIAERAREMLHADAVSIALFDDSGEGLRLVAWSCHPSQLSSPHPAGSWFPRSHIRHPAASAHHGNNCPIADPSFSRYTSPLCIGAEQIGELSVAVAESRVFSEEELSLLDGLAGLAAIAVHKSRLLERERLVAVLEERQRLAREMHDSLAQVLGYLNLRSQTALQKVRSNQFEKAETELEDMSTIAREAYADVREAILGLRESASPKGAFVESLREYLEKFSRQAGVVVRLETSGDSAIAVGPEAEIQLIRVIQEALTNVRKHAGANEARICIRREAGEAAIVVEDNGRGFDPTLIGRADAATFGLRTMRERVERAGGRFSVDSTPNKGTAVRVFLPLNGGTHHD